MEHNKFKSVFQIWKEYCVRATSDRLYADANDLKAVILFPGLDQGLGGTAVLTSQVSDLCGNLSELISKLFVFSFPSD